MLQRRFTRVRRKKQEGITPCRGTELSEACVAAHLAVQSTFKSKNDAKSTMTTTCTAVFGGVVWDEMNDEELKETSRLLSTGVMSLGDYVNVGLEAYGANDGTTPVFESVGATLIKAGLASVDEETGTCVDGPRIAAARAILRDQGYTDDSNVMRSLNIETILVIWLNLVQADPKCKFRLPVFVYAARVQKARERLALTSLGARRWAHCLWGAFGNVAPALFVELTDVYWALGAGRMCLLPRLNALGAGEVPAGALVVLAAAVDEVRADSPAAALLVAALARERAAANYFAVARTALVGGRRPPPRIIRPDDNTGLARRVRQRYRETLVFQALVAQDRGDLVKGRDVTRLRAFQADLARDAAAAAPTDAGDGLRRVVTFSCVVTACAAAYPRAEIAATEEVLHDDLRKEHVRQNVFWDALKRPGEAWDAVVALKNVRSLHGKPPKVLALLRVHVAAEDTLSIEGLRAEDNADVLTSPVGKVVLAAANAARTGDVGAALADVLKGFGPKEGSQLVSYLWTTLKLRDDSNLLGSLQWAGAAVSRSTGRVVQTWRDGPTGFDPLDALVTAHTRLSSGDPKVDLVRFVTTSRLPRAVDSLRCVQEKLEEARLFKQERAEAAAKAEADAAAAQDRAVALTAAAADGPLADTRFILAGHGTTSKRALQRAGAFGGSEGLYADDGELASLLRGRGARVHNLADEPRDSPIFGSGGRFTLCTDSRAILVLSDGYDRPSNRPPEWLDCFKAKGRAVKESYVRALAAADYDFDRVPLGPHLVYEPGTTNPRPV